MTIDIDVFLKEDCFNEDVTTASVTKFLGADPDLEFELFAKADGVFSGKRWLEEFEKKSFLRWKKMSDEGALISARSVIAQGVGKASHVLATERTLLNGLQLLCGVATQSKKYVDRVKAIALAKHMPAPAVLHTRKIQPGLRNYIADALSAGGAGRHRMNLSDRLLFKDNHRMLLKTDENLKNYLASLSPNDLQSGIFEADSESLLQTYIQAGIKHVMLDNFDRARLEKLLPQIPKHLVIEVSGGIRLDTLEDFVLAGVHRLSIGALTHGAKSLDISLEAKIG